MMSFQLLLSVVGVAALPASAAVTVTPKYTPLIVIFVSILVLFLVFFAIKLVYMKHRRIGTIHAPPRSIPSTSSLGPDKPGNRHRGLLVGCLGSPAWETSLTSKLDGSSWRQRQRSSFAYQLHTRLTTRSASKSEGPSSNSHSTKSTVFASHANNPVLPPSSRSISSGDHTSKMLVSVRQTTFTHCHPRYSDFGELRGMRPSGGDTRTTRRASPSSIRLVDGPSHSNQVEFAFLSAVPPNALVASSLMGTRDSFQLSRCTLKSHDQPVPPMPSLPSFLPFSLPNSPDTSATCPRRNREYLPPLRFSPLASVAKVFHASHPVFEKKTSTSRIPDLGRTANDAVLPTNPGLSRDLSTHRPIRNTTRTSNHKRSRSYKGLAIEGSLSRIPLVSHKVATLEDERAASISTARSRHPSVDSKKPLKSCLRQSSIVSTSAVCSLDSARTPSTLETTGDQVSIRTPISDDDIGLLGLDRFRWNDEIKELKVRSSHTKQDSVVVAPVWV